MATGLQRPRVMHTLAAITAILLVIGVLAAGQERTNNVVDSKHADRPSADADASAKDAGAIAAALATTTSAVGPASQGSAGQNAPAAGSGSARASTAPGSGRAGTPGSASGISGAVGPKVPVGRGVHGVTDSSIEVGLVYADLSAAYATIGALSGSTGAAPDGSSLKKSGDAVVEYINTHGGMAGRKVVPVWYQVNPSNATTPSGRQQEVQRACSTWTEDHHVFAASFQDGLTEENMVQCMAESKTVFIPVRSQPYMSSQRIAEVHDLYYAPSLLSAQRREQTLVDALWAQGFFTPGAKIASLTEDKPGIRAGVDTGMKPALAAHGLSLSTEIVYPDMIQSPWQNYILQLQSQGITHIIMSATTGSFLPTFFMMKSADNQGYHPHYGLASDGYPNGLAGVGAPHAQLANAQGMGTIPFFDTGDTGPQSDAGKVCAAIDKAASQPAYNAEFYCEPLFFLKQALERSAEISPAGMAAAVAGLGTGFQSMWTVGGLTRLSNDRHDGPGQYRDFAYDAQGCESQSLCFKYVGATKPLG